jgi:hypothetical protein
LPEVASKLGIKLRWIFAGGRCCQKFAWDAQQFSVDKFGHGRLQFLFEGCSHAEEEKGEGFGPTLLCSAYYGGLE